MNKYTATCITIVVSLIILCTAFVDYTRIVTEANDDTEIIFPDPGTHLIPAEVISTDLGTSFIGMDGKAYVSPFYYSPDYPYLLTIDDVTNDVIVVWRADEGSRG